MKSSLSGVIVLALVAVLSFGVADGQIVFNSGGSVTAAGGGFFLTVPEIRLGAFEGWVTWKLNLNDGSWEVVNAGLSQDIPGLGQRNANGKYFFDPQKRFIVMDMTFSDFLGCGVDKGMQALDVTSLTSTEMAMKIIEPSEPAGEPEVTCTRDAGDPDSIVGVWICPLGPSTLTISLNADRTVAIAGDMKACGDGD